MNSDSSFVINKDGILEKYVGHERDVIIPESVTSIGNSAFRRCYMTSVTIPKSVTSIGEWAFSECCRLTSVTIPDGVISIGNLTFSGCESLTSVTIPESVTSIGNSAFSSCKSLTSVTIPESVTGIGNSAFYGCKSLTRVAIPKSVISIGERAFSDCYGLTSVTIPESVTSIGNSAFSRCKSLTSMTIPKGVTSIGAWAFSDCYGLTSVTIPESVTSIGAWAFSECYGLTSVTIPESVTKIGDSAFIGCRGLRNSKGFLIVNNVLYDYYGFEKNVCIPENIINIGSAFSGHRELTSVVIPKSVSRIGKSAFCGCKRLTSVTIPEGVKSIGNSAFSGCKSLTSLAIPESVTEIGHSAFSGCSSILDIVIPDSVNKIEEDTFTDCERLSKVKIPDSLMEIRNGAFSGCPQISFAISEHRALMRDKLPAVLSQKPIETTEAGLAGLFLFQTGWKSWRKTTTIPSPELVFDKMIELVQKMKPFDKKLAAPVAEYILRYQNVLPGEKIQKMLSFFDGKNCKEIDLLVTDESFLAYLTNGEREENPIEAFARTMLKEHGSMPEVEKAVDKGIHYRNSDSICPREVIICLLSFYAREWKSCAVREQADLGYVEMLRDASKIEISKKADEIASALNRQELTDFLEKCISGMKYRLFLLSWARFAEDASVEKMTSKYKKYLHGPARDRYFAQNLAEALMINDTRSAMLFMENNEMLERYASMRGISAMEMRDTNMMPELGFDTDVIKRFDIGGNTIEARLTGDLRFVLYDYKKGKEIRSFPKKGEDPIKAETSAKEYADFKNQVNSFMKLRSEQLRKMHLSGDWVRQEIWRRVYLEHPVLKLLSEHVIWMDETGKTFIVYGNALRDVSKTLYEPQGNICVAHVLDMNSVDIDTWQHVLTSLNCVQLFEQVWEPVIKWEPKNIQKRYEGLVISSKARNALKASLKSRGIKAYAGEADREFNPHNWGYDFSDENTMFFGKSLRLDYSIDAENENLTLESATLEENPNRREINAILLELDKTTTNERIKRDDVKVMELMDCFTLAQISSFIKTAQEAKSINVLTLLMDYKNSHFSDFDPMDEFTLE